MTLLALYRCDACGKVSASREPGTYVYGEPAPGWVWHFGPPSAGPHACGEACWEKVLERHLAETGLLLLPVREVDEPLAPKPLLPSRPPPPKPPRDFSKCDRCGAALPPYSGRGRRRLRCPPPCAEVPHAP